MSAITHKTAVVTGGAQRIGGAISQALADDGWSVAIHYHDSSDTAVALADTIKSEGGGATTIGADLRDPKAGAEIVAQATDALGPVGALINNASLFESELWHDVTEQSWNDHLAVNLRAPFFLSQAFAEAMPEGSGGSIVNIIDQRVWNLTPNFFSYTVSKSGLWTLTQTLALALAPHIRVNAVGPGPTLANKRQDEAAFKLQAESMPLRHGAEPRDIAEAVLYLLNARAVTGQMIAVDGGEHLGWAQPSLARTIHE